MEPIGAVVTDDEKVLLTNYLCQACGKRSVKSRLNPRYNPAPAKPLSAHSHNRHKQEMPDLDDRE